MENMVRYELILAMNISLMEEIFICMGSSI